MILVTVEKKATVSLLRLTYKYTEINLRSVTVQKKIFRKTIFEDLTAISSPIKALDKFS